MRWKDPGDLRYFIVSTVVRRKQMYTKEVEHVSFWLGNDKFQCGACKGYFSARAPDDHDLECKCGAFVLVSWNHYRDGARNSNGGING